MPQNANAATVAKTPSGVQAPANLDATGNLRISDAPQNSQLNITAAAVVKATPGRIGTVIVTTAGSAPGSVSDVATTGGVAAANLIATLPNTVGTYPINFPAKVGIVVTPGTGQKLSISFD